MSAGLLQVDGDYRIERKTPDANNTYMSNGILNMTNAADRVLVNGNFITDSAQNHTGYLTSGKMEIKGNFTQNSTGRSWGGSSLAAGNFVGTGSHKVILSGSGVQEISFAYPGDSRFNILAVYDYKSGRAHFLTQVNYTTLLELIIADINQDGDVNIDDLVMLSIAFRSRVGDNTGRWNASADLDKNRQIDEKDLELLKAFYK